MIFINKTASKRRDILFIKNKILKNKIKKNYSPLLEENDKYRTISENTKTRELKSKSVMRRTMFDFTRPCLNKTCISLRFVTPKRKVMINHQPKVIYPFIPKILFKKRPINITSINPICLVGKQLQSGFKRQTRSRLNNPKYQMLN